MKVRNTLRVCTTLLAAILALAGNIPANAQRPANAEERRGDHAVSPNQLREDVQKASDTRQANERAVREMFASDALKSAGIDYRQVDQAISQVNDEDLARMAQRSHEVNHDFAAGRLEDRDLLIIVLVAVAVILIIVAVH